MTANTALLLLFIALASGMSLLLGQDANWDLQNYHYYNAWAWVHGRTFGHDLAAAQIQTFHNPLLDLPFYGMIAAGWDPRVIAIVLAIPAAVAALILYQLARLLFRDLPPVERTVAVASSIVVGMTSAMGLGALSNTMNEWPLAALSLLALWLVVRDAGRSQDGSIRTRTLLIAGVVVGVAAGAKLTAAPFAVGLCGALLCRGPYQGGRRRWAEASWLALGTTAGVALSFGPWGYALWNEFGNPVFPYANQWFRSPWWEAKAVTMPHSYGPHSFGEWLAFPFALFHPGMFYVAEVAYRDARIPLVYGLALLVFAWTLVRRLRGEPWSRVTIGPSAAWGIVAWFAALAFATWAVQYAIYRYLLPLDVLTGVLIAGLLCTMFRPRVAAAATVAAAVVAVATTQFANWGRIEFGQQWFEVAVPPVAPDALVIITTGGAVSYLLPLLPPQTRYVAANNTLVDPSRPTRFTQQVRDTIAAHRGQLYQLTYPLTEGSELLAPYGLRRRTADCAVIVTNMPTSPLELCRLDRVPEPRS